MDEFGVIYHKIKNNNFKNKIKCKNYSYLQIQKLKLNPK